MRYESWCCDRCGCWAHLALVLVHVDDDTPVLIMDPRQPKPPGWLVVVDPAEVVDICSACSTAEERIEAGLETPDASGEFDFDRAEHEVEVDE